VRELRRALGREVLMLMVLGREDGAPPPEADDVIREPVDPRELNLRVRLAVRMQAERRMRDARNEELATFSQSSWTPSLAGGADALFGQITRHAAQTLRAEKAVVLLYDPDRREMVAQPPGFGLDPALLGRLHYPVQGEARQRWNFRMNGALLTNDAASDARLMPGFVNSIGFRSLLITPILVGPHVIGLLGVADRPDDRPFRDADLTTLQIVAGQASVAVDNHRLHEQLKGANLRLKEFDRLKSEFVAMVAHDFRSPLMAIRGFAEMVLEDSDIGAENRKQFVQTIINETDDLARLATDTFLITQMETGHFTYHWSDIDLGAFILDAIARGRAEHPVGLDVPAGLPRVTADPERLRQVLSNLISNAVKYSPGGDSVLVRARQPAGGHVQIEVVDHGLGIPHDQMNRLFQKFERVRTEQHARIGGTGRVGARPRQHLLGAAADRSAQDEGRRRRLTVENGIQGWRPNGAGSSRPPTRAARSRSAGSRASCAPSGSA
jgi:signal transduction histidine kinase